MIKQNLNEMKKKINKSADVHFKSTTKHVNKSFMEQSGMSMDDTFQGDNELHKAQAMQLLLNRFQNLREIEKGIIIRCARGKNHHTEKEACGNGIFPKFCPRPKTTTACAVFVSCSFSSLHIQKKWELWHAFSLMMEGMMIKAPLPQQPSPTST